MSIFNLRITRAKYVMGSHQSKPDMYVLMIEGDVEVCCLGIFSTLDKAKDHVPSIGESRRRMWIEKFRVDEPQAYEDGYVVWESTHKR
jgi:hypothetical protein